jgi:ABC-type polysaccharide/polyol phosphate transport system ATPase subunit
MEKGKIIQEGDPSKVIQTYYNRAKKINKEGVE